MRSSKTPKNKKKYAGVSLCIAFFAGVVTGMYLAPPKNLKIFNDSTFNGYDKLKDEGTFHWDESMDCAAKTE